MTDIPAPYQRGHWDHGYVGQVGPLYNYANEDGYGLAFRVGDTHVNGMGRCHGGMLMGFADMAFGFVITIEMKKYWLTVRLLTDFLSGADHGDWVEGNAQITGTDGDFVFVKGKIWTGDRVILQGTGTFKALGPR